MHRLALLIVALMLTGLAANAQYPVVAGTNTSTDYSHPHNVALPAGIQSGDLLLVFWADGNTGTNANIPSGWTLIYNYANGTRRYIAMYRIATGTEGPWVVVTTSPPSSDRSAHNSYRISAGTYTGLPVAGTVATGNSQTPDPPNLTSGFGNVPTLWLAASHSSGDDNSPPPQAPINYINPITGYTGNGNSHARMLTTRRELTALSEDPGIFILGSIVYWGANTVAVQAATPTITLGSNPSVCEGITEAELPYSGTTNNPDQYTVDWNAAAEAEGFTDVAYTALPASPIVLTVPAGAPTGTYNGTLKVRNSSIDPPYESVTYNISVTVVAIPTITLGSNPTVCLGATSANLPYSAPTGSPDQYTIDWNAAAEGVGFIDVTTTALPASPIVLTLPGTAPEGTYNGTLKVNSSSSGCESTGYAISVTTIDDQDPVITCPTPSNPYDTDSDECNATLSFVATATDNCDTDVNIVYYIAATPISFPYDFPLGTTTVTAVASDNDSPPNTDECTFDVVVEDNQDPAITCPVPAPSYPADPGVCFASLSFTATATDNCGIDYIKYYLGASEITFDYNFPVGTTTVSSIATDINGNTATCNFDVVVVDDQDPTITCPADISQDADSGECYATINDLGSPITDDNCGIASVTNDAPADDQYDVGITIVTWTVEDESGNTASCEQTITVTDDEQPIIYDCPGNITVYTGPGRLTCDQNASWTPPTAFDNCDGVIIMTSTHNPGDLFPVGTTQVTYTAEDVSGNQSLCIFDVIVIDNTVPTFTAPLDITIYVNSSCDYDSGVAFTGDVFDEFDNCTPTGLQATYTDLEIPDVCPGTFIITRTWTLVDLYGNTTTHDQTITVADNLVPNLTLPPNITIQCHESILPANTGTPVTSDNCGGSVTLDYSDVTTSGSCPSEYNIIRTWTATDCSGNINTDDQLIQVRDDIAPTIVNIGDTIVACPADIPPPDTSVVTATDNCGSISIEWMDEIPFGLEDQPGYCPDSVHRIYRVTDECGNYTDAIHRIIVLDVCDCSPCADTLSFYTIDLIGQPTGDTTLYDVQRLDKCCDATNDYCVAFNVRIDDDAVGVQITIDGASPSPQDWRIDCEEVEIQDDIICIPGGEFYLFTYCKPGANKNDFNFQSIAGVVVVGELTTRVDCNTQLIVEDSISDPTWNSIYPGFYGQYNGYLSCTDCLNPIFTPDSLAPPEIHYQVCGGLAESPCIDETGIGCDTLIIYVLDDIHIEFDVDPGAFCQDNIPLICASAYPPGEYSYEWYIGYDSTGTPVGTDSCYQPLVAGQYSLVVTALDDDIPCSTYLFNFDVAPDDVPPVVYPPDPAELVLECMDPDNPQLILDWLALAYAIDDNTPNLYVENDYAGIDQYCNSSLTVTFTAEDSCGNIGSATAIITIIDTVPPVIECPEDIIIEPDPVTCAVEDPDLGMPVVNDLCPGVVDITNDAPAAFPPGDTYVTWTATDECGNLNTCTQKVTVFTLDPPLVECPEDVTVSADLGLCSADIIVPPPVVTDPCPYTMVNDYTGTDDASGIYSVGITIVTWTITGVSDNVATCTQTITVIDDQLPTITCPDSVFAIAEPPDCEVPDFVLDEPVYGDNCPDPLLTWLMTGATTGSGTGIIGSTTFNVGVTNITYIITDASANVDSCSFTVTVNDNVPPTIVYCPEDVEAYADEGLCETYISVPLPVVVDSCGEIVYINHDSPYGIDSADASGTYPVGFHMITWTFSDESGNSVYCMQFITVIDDQSPTIECPPDVIAIAEPPDCEVPAIIVDDPIYSDNCPDSVLTWIKTGATTGSGTGLVDTTTFFVGVTYVTYIITDASGNDASCSFTVTIYDEVPPTVITCPPDTTVYAAADSCEVYIAVPAPVVSDSCGEIVSISHDSPYGIDTIDASGIYPVGEYTVTWTFTDESDNDTSCVQIIRVLDTIAPVLICPDPFEWPADFNLPYATDVPVDPPTFSDNCSVDTLTWVMTGATIGSSPDTGINIVLVYTFNVGVTTITYTAIDPSGNISTCSFTVTITSMPEISCPNDTTIYANDDCIAFFDPGVPDTISGAPPFTWIWIMSGATVDTGYTNPIDPIPYPFNLDTTYITWIATNISGSDTCQQIITVVDTVPPTFDTPGPFEFCVYNIDTAIYNGLPEPDADIEPDRPDWYIIDGTSELDISNIADNCCEADSITIHWTITYFDVPPHPPVSGTGQPSTYGEITLWGTTDYTIVVHTITYLLEDCNGNFSEPVSVNITLKPRPYVSKPY